MRMVIVRNKDNSVSCLQMVNSKEWYEQQYKVICYINKPWNIFYVDKIKKYFKK